MTDEATLNRLVEAQRAFFRTNATKQVDFRINALKILRKVLKQNEERLMKALWEDLRKSPFESYETELGMVYHEITHMLRHIRHWAEPERKTVPLPLWPSSGKVHWEPYGVSLVVTPWNYPVLIALSPVIGSITAGNCTVLKVSPYSTATSRVIAEMIAHNFPPEYITVVQGGREVNKILFDMRFDYIFFTGSPKLGKVVMEAASRHLTPLTLELGGKSPCVVAEDANLGIAARRIVWGKFVNAGQTCIAPDYLLVDRKLKDALLEKMKTEIIRQQGNNPRLSPDFGRMINDEAFNRVASYLNDGDIVFGGDTDASGRYIGPTLLENVSPDSPVMQEEIFGPVLPVLAYDTLDEAIDFINGREKPLAAYFFTESKKTARYLLHHTSSGGGCINDCLLHIANLNLPFGGVGNSGKGEYHGRYSFETFSNPRSMVYSTTRIDLPVKYPPYGKKLGLIRWLLH